MEVSKLLEIIRIKTDDVIIIDDSDSLFKTSEILYYINNALREVVFRGRMLVKQDYTINLLTGVSEYPVPSGVVQVTQVIDENSQGLSKIQEIDFNQKYFNTYNDNFANGTVSNNWRTDTADLPYAYMQNSVNNKLKFYPIPSKDSIVNLRGSYIVEELDETDDIPIELSEIYHPDLIYWVLYEMYGKQDADVFDPQESENNFNKFEEIFGKKITGEQFQEMLEFPDDAGSLRDY